MTNLTKLLLVPVFIWLWFWAGWAGVATLGGLNEWLDNGSIGLFVSFIGSATYAVSTFLVGIWLGWILWHSRG